MIDSLQFQRRFSGLHSLRAFTMTELLVAGAITSCTLVLSGLGLSAMISSSTAVNESAERQDELNRAMDFIAAEIREAEIINQGDDPIPFVSGTSFYSDIDPAQVNPATVKEILWFEVNDASITDPDKRKVVYYIAEPVASPWEGPQAVFRWGPEFDTVGAYDASEISHSMLIDSLHNQINEGAEPDCNGWKEAIPAADAKAIGFYACIADGNKAASLKKVGQSSKVLEQIEVIPEERQIFARASQSQAPIPSPLYTGGSSSSCIGRTCSNSKDFFDEDPSGFKVLEDLDEVMLHNRGGAITCGLQGDVIPTETTAIFLHSDGTSEPREFLLPPNTQEVITNVPRDTIIQFVSRSLPTGKCSANGIDTRIDDNQVIVLTDGERVPFYEPYGNQQKIEQFLSSELVSESNVLNLPANRQVFLFELGVRTSGPAYDFQDVVLVADVKPRASAQSQNTSDSQTP